MINLFIPTRGGLNKNLFKQLTKYGIHDDLKVFICIDSDEIDLYKDCEYTKLIIDRSICENAICPVVPKRNMILDYARDNNMKHIFMIDDDTNLDHTGEKAGTKFGYGSTRVDVYSVLTRWLNTVPEDATMTTISKNIISREKLYKDIELSPTTSLSSVYHFNMKLLGDIEFTDMFVEDMDMLLKLISDNHRCYTIFTASKSCPPMGANVFIYTDNNVIDESNTYLYEKYMTTRLAKYLQLRTQVNGLSKCLVIKSNYRGAND